MGGEGAVQVAVGNETNSSVFEKVPREVRGEIQRALVEREPATFRGVYEKFKVAEYGVSYSSFYRYARRFRSQVAMFEMAAETSVAGSDLPAVLPKALAQRLLEVLAFEDASPRHIQRLTDAYRIAVNTQVLIRRHGLFRKGGAPDAGGDVADLLLQYCELVKREEAAKKK